MKAYKVLFREFPDIEHIKLDKSSAISLVNYNNERFKDNDCYYEETEIDKIANQSVNIDGDIVGYQFSRTKHGSRTVKRTVSNLHMNGAITGEVTFKGRTVVVRHKWLDCWETVKA